MFATNITIHTRKSRRIAAGILIICGLLGITLFYLPRFPLFGSLLVQATIYAIAATSVGILVRQTGLISFGQAAYFGLGVYLIYLNGKYFNLPLELYIPITLVILFLVALLLGTLIIRLPTLAFSMLTLAISQAMYELIVRWRELANGDDGAAIVLEDSIFGMSTRNFYSPHFMSAIAATVLMVVLLFYWLFACSKYGLLTLAIRENRERTIFLGGGVFLPQVLVYAGAGVTGGVAGILYALYNTFAAPVAFHWSLSGELLLMALIGGSSIIWGPALGAVVFFFLKFGVGTFTVYWPALMGVLLIIILILLPTGIGSIFAKTRK